MYRQIEINVRNLYSLADRKTGIKQTNLGTNIVDVAEEADKSIVDVVEKEKDPDIGTNKVQAQQM